MSESLQNRHRPRRFADLIGQEQTATALRHAVSRGKLAPLYLFSGPQGTGKTSAARVLARAVNCLEPLEGEPCGRCTACSEPDINVEEMDAASERGIDAARSLRDRVSLRPLDGGRAVFILDEAHQITHDAFNALLKTFEDAPEHVLFILATTEPSKVPDTIRSRAQHYPFHRASQATLVTHLANIAAEEKIRITAPALELIARASAGGIRDALVLMAQSADLAEDTVELPHVESFLGVVGEAALRPLLAAYGAHDLALIFTQLGTLARNGADGESLLAELLELVQHDFTAAIVGAARDRAKSLYPLLDELARAGELVVSADQSYIPIELAFFRALESPTAATPTAPASPAGRPPTPSAPTAPARSASAVAPLQATLTLESVKLAWRRMPELLRAAKLLEFVPYCTGIFPEELHGDLLTLGATGKIDHSWLRKGEHTAALRKLLSAELGAPLRIVVRDEPTALVRPTGGTVTASASRSRGRSTSDGFERFATRSAMVFDATFDEGS